MESSKNLTFLDIISNYMVRKEILKNIKSFTDICNLARTSKQITLFINNDKIKKNIMCYYDSQQLTIKPKDGIPTSLRDVKFKNVDFENEVEILNEIFDDPREFPGEIILRENRVCLVYNNRVEHIRRNEFKLFTNELIKIMDLNNPIRKDVTVLEFNIDIAYNLHMIFVALKKIKHENIRRIKIPEVVLLDDPSKYVRLGHDMFNGLPNFHELEITPMFTDDKIIGILDHNSIFDFFMKELSRRKNATLILPQIEGAFLFPYNYIDIILTISRKYNVKLKCSVRTVFPFMGFESDYICPYVEALFFPIKAFITTIQNEIRSELDFVNVMNYLQFFKNLESLTLELDYFITKKDIEIMSKSDIFSLSLRRCRKLKKFKIYVSEYFDFDDKILVYMYRNNLKFLVSLLPKTVRKFELVNGSSLNKTVMKVVNRCLPNIKTFMSYNIEYIGSDCLMALKNLQAFVGFNTYPIKIPDTVKFLAIGHWDSEEHDHGSIVNHEFIKSYSKKFSKSLQNDNGTHIFFNDVKNWNDYKHLVQKYYFT